MPAPPAPHLFLPWLAGWAQLACRAARWRPVPDLPLYAAQPSQPTASGSWNGGRPAATPAAPPMDHSEGGRPGKDAGAKRGDAENLGPRRPAHGETDELLDDHQRSRGHAHGPGHPGEWGFGRLPRHGAHVVATGRATLRSVVGLTLSDVGGTVAVMWSSPSLGGSPWWIGRP